MSGQSVGIRLLVVLGAAALALSLVAQTLPPRFGFGIRATAREIRAADDEATPTGHGLPPGQSSVAEGKRVYASRCASCHGATGVEGPMDKLVGRMPGDSFPFGRDPALLAQRTIGNYWPYATTLYDFIRRAMPQDRPGSLSPRETYAVVAYLLYRNGLIPETAVLDARALLTVRMPAQHRFVVDDRIGGPTVR